MLLCYSGRSAPSANKIADESDDIMTVRRSRGDINWGRYPTYAKLNRDIRNAVNKRRMRQLFKENGVPMPYLYENVSEALQAVRAGKTLVGRPDRHTKGRGFWLIRSEYDLRKALRGTRRKRAATHFMDKIQAPREYRVHIFLGKSIRISEKSFGETGRTATGNYITRKPRHEVKHIRKAAKQAMEAIGLDFGAVDVLANDTEAWVLECNSAPGLGGSMARLYAQKFQEWYRGEYDEVS
jgi:glutathione synthase/RimK-type ligase-like ATP-grasp enzyme